MFDFLKKKITGFVDKLTRKEESKEEVEEVEEVPEEEIIEEKVEEKIEEIPVEEKIVEEKIEEKVEEEKIEEVPKEEKPKAIPKPKPPEKKKEVKPKPPPKPKEEKPIPEKKIEKPKPEKPKAKIEEKPKKAKPGAPKPEIPKAKDEKPKPKKEAPVPKKEKEVKPKPKEKPLIPKIKEEKKEEELKPEIPEPAAELPEYKEEKKKGISLSPLKAIKSFITREVEISESDVHGLLENLELELLEADVELGVAEAIRQELQAKLVGSKIKKKELDSFIKNIVRDTLVDIMSSEKAFDLLEFMEKSEKPVKLVFLGLNGTGKTTSIGKVAHLLMQNKYKVVFAAADTFRAAAIEQMEVHADRLDVKIIKRDYGADPTSVGYDAVSYAKAHGIDAVLIDTAGRQDTNINLINELKKMDRVLKPDLKLYIGESIAGSSVIEQISTFHEHIGIDGVILTKLDCDPKGGTILSITKATGIPVIYIGTGQKYEDLERFEAGKIIDRILT